MTQRPAPTAHRALLLSPQRVDPLSWFTRPFLPVAFAIAIVAFGVVFLIATSRHTSDALLHWLSIGCLVAACFSIQARSGPRIKPFLPHHAIAPLALSWLGVAISAVATEPTDFVRWWAPLGASMVLAALAPYCSTLLLIIYGLLTTVFCSVVAVVAFATSAGWPLLSTIVIGGLAPLQATIATALFSGIVVLRILRWSQLPIQATLATNVGVDFSQWNAQHGELKLLSDRVMLFIEQVARAGRVNTRDRDEAASLAKEVRDALLQTVDRSWLDNLADGRVEVIDPNNRAGRLTLAQRGAVRSLLVAVLESPALVPDTLGVELRDSEDGGVAVALTMKLTLPEGKRMMMLAPYYLTLQATVDDLVWEDHDLLKMRFQIPAPGENRD